MSGIELSPIDEWIKLTRVSDNVRDDFVIPQEYVRSKVFIYAYYITPDRRSDFYNWYPIRYDPWYLLETSSRSCIYYVNINKASKDFLKIMCRKVSQRLGGSEDFTFVDKSKIENLERTLGWKDHPPNNNTEYAAIRKGFSKL